ncbi:MAG: PAS domain S-box protein [Bacteriovoracaceae bacterium]
MKHHNQKLQFKDKFFDISTDLFCVTGFDTYIKEVNHTWKRFLGWDIEDMYFRPFREFIHPDDRDRLNAIFEQMVKQEIYVAENLDFRLLLKNGSWNWMRANVYLNFEDKVIYSMSRDINDIKRDQILLEKIQEEAKIGGWEYDFFNNNLYWSSGAYTIFGVDSQQFRPNWRNCLTYFDKESAKKLHQIVEDIKTQSISINIELELTTHNNDKRWVNISARPIFESGKISKIFGTIQDISDRVSSKKKILESERFIKTVAQNTSKIVTMGEVAGGIAHEINNPLAIIYGSAEELKKFLDSVAKMSSGRATLLTDKILKTTERVSKIVKSIKSFSRNVYEDPFELVELDNIIQETLDFGEARIKQHNVVLRLDKLTPHLMLECRSVQISQVILNLLNNATDAVCDTVNPWISLETHDKNDQIEIRVTDSGMGIKDDVVEKLMTPFFTTKGVGKGTGLGLSVSKQIIVDSHKGEFFYNRSSFNTQFVIKIPKKQNVQKSTKVA